MKEPSRLHLVAPKVRPVRWLRNCLGVAALCGSAGLLSTACEDNESMLFIYGVKDLNSFDDCVPDESPDGTFLNGGTLDVLLTRSGYHAALLVGSQLTSRGSRNQLRTETARFVLQGTEVTLTDGRGRVLPLRGPGGQIDNPYSTLGTGNIEPSSGQEAAYGLLSATLIPPGVELSDSLVIARVRAFGKTLGGTELETPEYSFPIQICQGCLIAYPSSAADDTSTAPGANPDRFMCRVGGGDDDEIEACIIGQDALVPCTACSGTVSACTDPCQNCLTRNEELCAGTVGPAGCP